MRRLFTVFSLVAFAFVVTAFYFKVNGPAIERAAEAKSKNMRNGMNPNRTTGPAAARRSGRTSG